MLDKVIVIYAIIDDLLKAIGHFDDCRRQMSDAEILTTALVAVLFFYGNHAHACKYMQEQGLVESNAMVISVQSSSIPLIRSDV